MPHPLSARCFITLLGLLWVAIVPAGCITGSDTIVRLDDVTKVSRLSNTEARESEPIALLKEFTLQDYEIALRRVVITHSTWIGTAESDPKPLFTDAQVRVFTRILKKYLPGLGPEERLLFRFQEPHKDLDVLAEVYGDGEYMVFDFRALSRDIGAPAARHMDVYNRASIVRQSGQLVQETTERTILKEPIRRDVLAIARLRQKKLDLLDSARRDDVIQEDEAGRLRQIVETEDGLSVEQFKLFMEKRSTLEKALQQGLFNQQEYSTRKERLTEELRQ